ncbi:unnamed protein product, partial [Mesorhabditis belari]|uniref:Major facilitator superfamily (MFS) profile domain-containing protein n=1 Tax=Mesorhabditis belari TaxID=2138241 RepID=A0AAF3EAP9_9BILA
MFGHICLRAEECGSDGQSVHAMAKNIYLMLTEGQHPPGATNFHHLKHHFEPHTWFCDVAKHIDDYFVIHYSHNIDENVGQFKKLFEISGVPETYADQTLKRMQTESTHSDRNDTMYEMMLDEIYSNQETLSYIVASYYYDYKLLKIPFPKGDFASPASTTAELVSSQRFACFGRTRLLILILATFYLSTLQSSVIAYNATFVVMMDITSSPLYHGNLTFQEIEQIDWASSDLSMSDRRFRYDMLQKGLSFAGAYGGALIGTQPLTLITVRYGAHKVMTIIGILATVSVALTPICVSTSFWLFVVVRVVAGLSLSNLFPVAAMIVNQWASNLEKGLFVAVLSGYVELSPLITMPLAGIVATGVSWPAVFYFHAILSGLFTTLWVFFYRDQPKSHPFVGKDEYAKVSEGKPADLQGKSAEVPIVRILKSIVIWAVWIAVIGNFFVIQFSITFAPMYLAYVLQYSALESGFITMIPLFLLLLIKFITGIISDRMKSISEVGKMRLFSSLSLLGSGIFFILVSYFPPGYHIGDVVLIVIPVALLGFQSGGYPKCIVMVARQHSAWVMSIVQMLAVSTLIVGSFVVPAMTRENTFEQWRNVFTLYAALMVLCNTIFVCFARADPCKWTFDVAIGQDQVRAVEEAEREVRRMCSEEILPNQPPINDHQNQATKRKSSQENSISNV